MVDKMTQLIVDFVKIFGHREPSDYGSEMFYQLEIALENPVVNAKQTQYDGILGKFTEYLYETIGSGNFKFQKFSSCDLLFDITNADEKGKLKPEAECFLPPDVKLMRIVLPSSEYDKIMGWNSLGLPKINNRDKINPHPKKINIYIWDF